MEEFQSITIFLLLLLLLLQVTLLFHKECMSAWGSQHFGDMLPLLDQGSPVLSLQSLAIWDI